MKNMEEYVDKTMANLKLLGMVAKGQKICIRKGQLNIEPIDRIQFVRRWLNKDSRDVTLIHIRNTINDAIKIAKGILANTLHTDLKNWTVAAVSQEMKNCENGLQNLKSTYIDDPCFIANIDVLIDRCKAQCEEIDRAILELSDGNIQNSMRRPRQKE